MFASKSLTGLLLAAQVAQTLVCDVIANCQLPIADCQLEWTLGELYSVATQDTLQPIGNRQLAIGNYW
jgi:hypothetical protein